MENPFEFYSEIQFKKRFRFRKEVVRDILLPMVHVREPMTNRGLPVPTLIGLLLTLRFYASGSFQIVCGDLKGLSQSTVSRVVTRITRRLAAHSRTYITFPLNEDIPEMQRQFSTIANFPNVTGCVDCTHITIKSPGGDVAELFRNRKRYFSINVQATSGPNLQILDIVSRYPGSYHDSYIFQRSSLKGKFQRRELPGYLLGDAGYPCLPYLLTPFRQVRTPGERRYNQAHIQTRNTVERLFGVLKRRFPCLSRGLATKISTSCYIIVACAILHNISITYRDIIDEPLQIDDDVPEIIFREGNLGLGNVMRNHIVHNYFD
ncbi:putative nuclease HARBI1 isoform X2 [Sitophilus oryzae]|nr:putative nuclease HARBI1 isoform X2 [Sitophilus oryzae]XP_030748963.1 putative nuclease HARBI1 isoform X2 [Sitophilus oryzae]XP_030748971.1 putative nuclease HARBI1 isoform X2 [Sitophilus oryzae]XP_030751339.1 putative nuclease HARBI1 isoform X2 [Sitophilus oryzae]XP_030752951.1 putative nuclease HARBI1 isoform X2 [Sitophilus oryzae]XP_030760780.1 putative nuclease HARBI1 isoform X2 [Sitophilus oryzae]